MGAIITLEIKKYTQDRGLLFWMIILPILFTVLFASILTSGTDQTTRGEIMNSLIPGYIVMFVFFVIFNMVETFLKDKALGMTARLASTPLSLYFYLLGKWIPNIFIALIQIATLFLFGHIVYDVPLQQPLFLFILSLALAFTVTGFGLAIAFVVNTNNMGIAITQVIAMGGAILGGLWIPIDTMPEYVQFSAKLLPHYWAHQSYLEAIAGTLEWSEFIQSTLLLFGYGLIGFIIALLRYPRFLKSSRG